jgi:hypothetical protein
MPSLASNLLRNGHQMLLSDDAPCDGVSGRCQANPLFALNGGARAYMLWAAASFDLRQHFVDDGISASAVALQRIS